VNVKKILWIAAALFVVFFTIQSPHDASDIGRSLGHGIGHAFTQLSTFVKDL
jgi:hypothetical protein